MMTARVSTIVFGEVLVDEAPSGHAVGGAPFNVARHLAAFMAPPLMITRIGDDRNGAAVRAEFEHFVIPEAGLQIDPMEETGRAVAERSQRYTLLPRQAYDFIDPARAAAAVAGGDHDLLYFGTLVQREERSRLALAAVLENTQAKRFLDLNLRAGHANEAIVTKSLTAADVVKVNEEELQDLFGWYTHLRPATDAMRDTEVQSACATLLRIFNLQGMIVTLGARGAVHFGADGTFAEAPPAPMPGTLVDTVGAGDAFSAVFLLGRAHGWPLAQTLTRANEFAGAVCCIAGAVPSSLAFYRPFIERWLA